MLCPACKKKIEEVFTEDNIAIILKQTHDRWDNLQEYEKVSLPKAGIRLYAQAILKELNSKLTEEK